MNNKVAIFNKEDGIVNELLLDEKELQLFEKIHEGKHLCWDCSNGFVNKCQKIADQEKEEIGSYDFIINGYQLIIFNRLEKFIITKCQNFYIKQLEKENSEEKEDNYELIKYMDIKEYANFLLNHYDEIFKENKPFQKTLK